MNFLQTQPGIGLEEIATAAFTVLHGALNAELAQIEASKVDSDRMLDEMRGKQFEPVTLEPIERGNFHLGHVPSLIVDENGYAPELNRFPAVSVMCYRAQPSPGGALFDHANEYADSLYVESIVTAGPDDGTGRMEEVCDKRIWRTVEAVNNVLMRNQTLNGNVVALEQPTAVVSEVFLRPQSDLNTEITWFWQAGRVEYVVTKFSPFE